MRRNKFVNYLKDHSDLSIHIPSDLLKQNQQNNISKIYYPELKFQQLISNQIKKNNLIKNIQTKSKFNKKQQNINKNNIRPKQNNYSNLKREKVFSQLQIQSPRLHSKQLKQYNTIDLKNLPGAAYRKSGITIYRSKNIRSTSKLQRQYNSQIHKKHQNKKISPIKNQQSNEFSFKKIKTYRQKSKNPDERCIKLYHTYIRSKSQLKTKHFSFISIFQIQQTNDCNIQDKLCSDIIESEVYRKIDFQQFF